MPQQKFLMIDWSRERVMELIGYWKNCECLYNPSHTLYSNKAARQDALQRITQQMQVTAPQMTMNAVKTKMNYLRSQYCREMHKFQLAAPNNNATDQYANCPYWFESMSFVQRFVKVRAGALKRSSLDLPLYHLNSSNDCLSIDEMPLPAKRSKSTDDLPSSTEQTEEAHAYLYGPDPEVLELFQRQIDRVTSSQPHSSTAIKSEMTQPHLQPTSSVSFNNEYDQMCMNFIKLNLALITDAALKDELMDKITMLLLEYKGKQRRLDSQQA